MVIMQLSVMGTTS